MRLPRMSRHRMALTAIIASLILIATAIFIIDERSRHILSPGIDKSIYPVTGVDLSSHNGTIDFHAVAADSIDFVILKATEGADFKDRTFADNYRRARKAGLKIGVYHFFRFDTPGHMQAINLLNSIRGRHLDLPLAIDVEEWTNPDDQSIDAVLARLEEMTDYLTDRGYQVIIYTNKQGLARFFTKEGSKGYSLWICSFSQPEQGIRWSLWQHSHHGKVEGIESNVDLNTFNGSRVEWEIWLDSLQLTQ